LIFDLLQGRGLSQDVAGPIGIIDQANTYGFFDGGWLSIINFAALLSINLGIMNLLPLPALDGGRAVLVLLEKVFKKEKLDQIAHYLNYFGYISLLALMVIVSFNDIRNIFK
jgi:regulator of sigma E protease